MPFKLFDFPIFDYFHSRNESSRVPIFNNIDSETPPASAEVDIPLTIKDDAEILCKTGSRDSMLKTPDSSCSRYSPSEWSHHPFVKPNYSTTTRTYKDLNGEWTIQTRVGTFSGSTDQLPADFFGSHFDSGFESNLFGPQSGSNLFGFHSGSNFGGSSSDSDFFESGSDSMNDQYSSSFDAFPFSNIGGSLFQQMFDMMRQFQYFSDSFDPFRSGMGPPRG